MEDVHFYDVSVKWITDRKGTASSEKLEQQIEVATPPEFAKGIPNVWSPEHFFIAAVNSCLMTSFLAIAENSNLKFISFHSKAKGKIEKIDGKLMISEIILMPILTIYEEEYRDKAMRVLNKSEEVCLISNSIKSNIIFKPEVIVDTIK